MISRHWKGIAKKDKADEYIDHLKNETFKNLKSISGFISAQILNREHYNGIEFLIITNWKSLDVIKQFAGKEIEAAVVPELVQEMMIQYDERVTHYEMKFEED